MSITKSSGMLVNRLITSNKTIWLEFNFDNQDTKSKVSLMQDGCSCSGIFYLTILCNRKCNYHLMLR